MAQPNPAPPREIAFDGLVGPTHHYAGLSHGNLASERSRGDLANPRAAALQGLAKMRAVVAVGAEQALLPPHERPYLRALRRLGFSGDDASVLGRAWRDAPWLLHATTSASSMWAANMATVTPSSDSADQRVHFTPANLITMLHRSFEPEMSERLLRVIFAAPEFVVHEPLPPHPAFSDEGAANHTRLATTCGPLHLFGWGQAPDAARPALFPARQARAASEAVIRRHCIPDVALLWQQSPAGIDAGAFHSDVLCVGSGDFFMLHEHAFVDTPALVRTMRERLGAELALVVASASELPLTDAVGCYPFNSELLPLPDGKLALLAPKESENNPAARDFLSRVLSEPNAVERVLYVDVNASMRNGGGPACLRLRVPLNSAEKELLNPRLFCDATLLDRLEQWVTRHYRDRLSLDELVDPQLLTETRTALDELTQILDLGALYDFQRA